MTFLGSFCFSQEAVDTTLSINNTKNQAADILNSSKENISNKAKSFLPGKFKKPSINVKGLKDTSSIVSKDTTKKLNKDAITSKLENNKIKSVDSTKSSDSIASQAKDKVKSTVAGIGVDEKIAKAKGNFGGKTDSLNSNNIQQKAKESAAVKNITDRFQALPITKDTSKNSSLSLKNSTTAGSYFDAKEKLNIKGKTSGYTNGIYAKKESLIAKKNNFKTDSLKPKAKDYAKKQIKQINPKGSVALGYEYGVLPSVVGGVVPTGGYRAQGQVGFDMLGLPLQASFHYTDIKNTVGLNNYFKISYDANQYKEQMAQKMNVKNQVTQKLLTGLQSQQQLLMQQLDYSNMLNQSLDFQNPFKNGFNAGNLTNGLNVNNLTNGLNTNYNLNSLLDTSGMMSNLTQNLNFNQFGNIDTSKLHGYSIPQIQYLQKKDSINKVIADSKAKYDSINKLITDTEQQLKEIKNIQSNAGSLSNPYLSKVQQFMSHVKKLEIGMCNPTYSMFLVNNVPLQGLNFEYEKNNNFFAVTYGTTMNNLMFNTNTLQGAIQGARNLYNYFDFGNLSEGRKILSVKGGVGTKDQTHLFVGFLVGKGNTNYNKNDTTGSSLIESNVVLELDAKYVFNQSTSIDVIVGKSSLRDNDLSMNQISKAVNEIFSHYRSNAALVRFNYAIKKTNTKITATTRWIDPYFKSFGVGFLRSDNLRYEFKAEQPITKRIKYTVTYRREEDNILNILAYKNTLQSINNTVSIKLKKGVNIRLNYAPLFRELKTADYVISDKNYMTTAIITWVPKLQKVSAQFNALYSRYIITGDSANINFENFTYSQLFQFKSGLKTSFTSTWFKDNLKDSLNNDTYLSVVDIGYASEKGYSISVGGKLALRNHSKPQYGFIARVGVKLYKGLSFEAEAEKIVIGDYYSPVMVEQIKKFPFYFNNKLIYTF